MLSMALATAINSNVAKVSMVMIYLSSKIMASTPPGGNVVQAGASYPIVPSTV